MRGRPRKPTECHIAEGTYRKDRHGDAATAVPFPQAESPAIEKPHFTNAAASELWDRLVADAYWLKPIHAPLLESTCHMYGLYVASYQIAEQDPTDKDARIAVTAYWAKYEKGCSVLAVEPTTMPRQVEKPKQEGVRRRQA